MYQGTSNVEISVRFRFSLHKSTTPSRFSVISLLQVTVKNTTVEVVDKYYN